MMVLKKLLELSEKLKKNRPNFRRQEAHRRKRLTKSGWRRPKGFHSKLRKYQKGKGARAQVGYGGPKSVRGYHKSGKLLVLISNVSELETIDKSTQLAVVSSTVGMKKRLEVVKKAKKLGIIIQNISAGDYEEFVNTKLADRKAARKARKAKKSKKKKKASKKEKESKAKDKSEAKAEVKKKVEPVKKEKSKKKKAVKPKVKLSSLSDGGKK